jgi:hypothetical protein
MRLKPDVMLPEIHRQALDNPIIRIAHDVRRGKGLPPEGRYGKLRITDWVDPADYDVVLCGTNATRNSLNHELRRRFGFRRGFEKHKELQQDETRVCLRNDYQVREPVYNGQLWTIDHVDVSLRGDVYDMRLHDDDDARGGGAGSQSSRQLARSKMVGERARLITRAVSCRPRAGSAAPHAQVGPRGRLRLLGAGVTSEPLWRYSLL